MVWELKRHESKVLILHYTILLKITVAVIQFTAFNALPISFEKKCAFSMDSPETSPQHSHATNEFVLLQARVSELQSQLDAQRKEELSAQKSVRLLRDEVRQSSLVRDEQKISIGALEGSVDGLKESLLTLQAATQKASTTAEASQALSMHAAVQSPR